MTPCGTPFCVRGHSITGMECYVMEFLEMEGIEVWSPRDDGCAQSCMESLLIEWSGLIESLGTEGRGLWRPWVSRVSGSSSTRDGGCAGIPEPWVCRVQGRGAPRENYLLDGGY